MPVRTRIKIPETASVGEIITIKTLASHRMESGHRTDKEGTAIPRKIINQFTCEFNGEQVFSCDLNPSVAANPYFKFTALITEAGTFKFTWIDDENDVTEAERKISIV